MLEFDIKLSQKDLYSFNLYQNYRSFNGWLAIILGILSFVMAVMQGNEKGIVYSLPYVGAGIIFIIYIPVSLWNRVKLTLKTNESLSQVLHYEISEECIKVSQGTESAELPWEYVYRMVADSKKVLIYSGRKNAYIIPRNQLGDKYEQLCDVASKKLEKYRLKLAKS